MTRPTSSLTKKQFFLIFCLTFASSIHRSWSSAESNAVETSVTGATIERSLKALYEDKSKGTGNALERQRSSAKQLERGQGAIIPIPAKISKPSSVPQLTVVLVTMFDHLPRAMAALAAAYKNLAPELVREYIVVCPQAEAAVLGRTLKAPDSTGGARSPPLRILSDQQALGLTLAETKSVPFCGYRTQMAVKLTVSSHVSTDHYLILDSDVLLVRPVNASVASWLYPQPGKSVYHSDVRRRHARWWRNSETTLKLSGCVPSAPETEVSGVTPAILNTAVARAVVDRWAELFGGREKGVMNILSKRGPYWTEYTSYHLLACHMGGFDKYHSKPLPGAPALYQGYWQRGTTKAGIDVCANCLFMVVQDHIGVNIRDVVKSLDTLFDAKQWE
ncbi:hypothetical protein Agub_g10905 [Astrephomene gubernaculifera]|uniref:Glycosyltransferase n=1 Tax=Astrephomene gubernaculifera TaxID=47775 RepID=A0AAD3DVZ2_9CHLO|nr:hypothetical protein Agub_g10905 [Astrephomene gubernaculifera]